MALKSIDDVDGNGFDDELFAIKIAYLAKSFRNFLNNFRLIIDFTQVVSRINNIIKFNI